MRFRTYTKKTWFAVLAWGLGIDMSSLPTDMKIASAVTVVAVWFLIGVALRLSWGIEK